MFSYVSRKVNKSKVFWGLRTFLKKGLWTPFFNKKGIYKIERFFANGIKKVKWHYQIVKKYGSA